MGIFESAKEKLAELMRTGESLREREAETAKAALEQKAAQQSGLKADYLASEPNRAEHIRRDGAADNPAHRLVKQVIPSQAPEMRTERRQAPQRPEISEEPVREAEQMKMRLQGLQRAPSPGGSNFVSSLPLHHFNKRQQEKKQEREAATQREQTPIEKFQDRQKSSTQDQSAPAQKQTLEQRIKALDQELGRS